MYTAIMCFKNKSIEIPMEYYTENNNIVLSVKKDSVPEGLSHINIFYNEFFASSNDDGYYLIPDFAGGRLVRFKDSQYNGIYDSPLSSLRLIGIKRNGFVAVGKILGMQDEYNLVCEKSGNSYHYYIKFPLDGRRPYEDIKVVLHIFDDQNSDFSDMACWYRDYGLETGELTTLSEKRKKSEIVDYAADSVNIRIRLAWKPAPSKILEQTHENEPPLKIACTFRMVEELMDEIYKLEVKKADICLVGWNISGHDGRWPEMFPVEPKLGGETGLKSLIKRAEVLGYRVNLHTNCTDAYSIAEDFSEDYIIKNKDGTLSDNYPWSGGKMYNVSVPLREKKYIDSLKRIKKLGVNGTPYCDVMTAVLPRRSYDIKRPITPKEYRESTDRIFYEMQKIYGAASSEGGIDRAIKHIDYVLYGEMGKWKSDFNNWMDEIVPVWSIVYHGIILYNASNTTINYAIKSDDIKIKMIETDARPVAYCFVDFIENLSVWGSEDLVWQQGEKPHYVAECISRMYNEYSKRCNLQNVLVKRYEYLSENIRKITYEDGTVIKINYSNKTCKFSKISCGDK